MATSYICTFNELFTLKDEKENIEIKQVIIPIIQRDYAQGRKNIEIKRIRDRFLNSLFDAINKNGIFLDFVYGNINENGVLTPLDGQQRLTTLFLLYWYAAKKENINKEDYLFLNNFSYETRYSSRDFCQNLIDFNPSFSDDTISSQIENQSWFPLDWKNDQTINSMLVMIDAIKEKDDLYNIENLWAKLNIYKKIKFYFLPIKNMGLTDELYIKMNSRGKPLTYFEHFKAEFERQIEIIDKNKAKEIERKIDLDWTDFLWEYRKDDSLTDNLFLNYFRYICDIICYKSNQSTQNRSYDAFDLIDEYFGEANNRRLENLEFLEMAFDCWSKFNPDLNSNLFAKFITLNAEEDKVKLFTFNNTNLLDDCLINYYDKDSERRSRTFNYSKFILLYSFMLYALNKEKITEEQMSERIRIINNLVSNSNDEMNDSETRMGGNRLPSILKQTESIIINGVISDDIEINFNSFQLKEEKDKIEWRKNNPDKISLLNKLENHELLNGQISIVGLENSNLFDKFSELFKCDKDKISRALLAFGDYSSIEKGYRHQYGVDKNNSWSSIFHKSSADGFNNTKNCLINLLSSLTTINDQTLNDLIQRFLNDCENNKKYDLRYYFIQYKDFRPNTFGKYFISADKKYDIIVLSTSKKLSENAYQPFLKCVDCDHLDRESYGTRLKINDKYVYCEEDGFSLKDENNEIVKSLKITQDNDGIDKEDRIEKYRKQPLI